MLREQEQTNTIPAIELPRDVRGRIMWSELGQDQAHLIAVIEGEASRLLESGVSLSPKDLYKVGASSISSAITRLYPEGYFGLRQKLNLPTGPKPKDYWTRPGMTEKMRQEVSLTCEPEGEVSLRILQAKKRHDLINGIQRHYPGGWVALRKDLGLKSLFKPDGYWTPEQIKLEAKAFIEQYQGLSKSLLEKADRGDLATALSKYPGGIPELKKELGIEDPFKPKKYWTPESIRTEALAFYSQFGVLSSTALVEHNRHDLLSAIGIRYPGTLTKLRNDLNLEIETRKEPGYWTESKIKEETMAFYNQFGVLSQSLLTKNGRQDLLSAIALYPGRFGQLMKDLGIRANKKPDGFWNLENIEKEALQFWQTYGSLKSSVILAKKYSGLGFAIRKYPGGLDALKAKLGIDQPAIISPEEAEDEFMKAMGV